MSQRTIHLPVDQVAEVSDLQTRLQRDFSDRLLGLYLYGSAVWGDFDPAISDIDLLAVLATPVVEAELPTLLALHDAFVADYPEWSDRVEVQYFTPDGLAHFRERESPMANISPGEPLHLITAGHDWLSNWYFVQEYGVTLFGPSPDRFIPPIQHEEFLAVVRTYAAYFAAHPEYGSDSLPAQGYAIMSMCRALYTVTTGEQVSKARAVAWVAERHPEEAPLLADALRWRRDFRTPHPDASAYLHRTQAFVQRMQKRIDATPAA